ncbi:MAG: hypothetical protein AABX11_07250 [Nanoarchaeota archaeon]
MINRRKIKKATITALVSGVFLAVAIPITLGVIAYKGYKSLRRSLDEEYEINDDIDRATRSIRYFIEESLKLPDKNTPRVEETAQFRTYKSTLERAVEFYEGRGKQYIANNYIAELNRMLKR